MIPPKPGTSESRNRFWRLVRGFRNDLLSALPERLYRAWMAEYRNPLIHSFVCNDPTLVKLILRTRPDDFPKSGRLREGLVPLLGNSIFVTNGEEWRHQRRIIDPAFEGGRLRDTFTAIWEAAETAVSRLEPGEIDIEPEASHAAADVIFRALFSLPIEHEIATAVFRAFREHQEAQPIVNIAALVPLPRWLPRPHSLRTRKTAAEIRGLIERLVSSRLTAIAAGIAPDDLATKIMTTPDPETGMCFSGAEMVDQVAIFFLAGHETSASTLAWALWLLATNPDWQDKVASEGAGMKGKFSELSRLKATRAVFKETLRLYPPVPMMVREASRNETFRNRKVPRGAQLVLSPWHLHRHKRLWENPDAFDPARWNSEAGKTSARDAFIPFSAGQRVCPGAGFAMMEGMIMLARIAAAYRLSPGHETPVPVARLTVRGKNGIMIRLEKRDAAG